jgi:hypothetical protein
MDSLYKKLFLGFAGDENIDVAAGEPGRGLSDA